MDIEFSYGDLLPDVLLWSVCTTDLSCDISRGENKNGREELTYHLLKDNLKKLYLRFLIPSLGSAMLDKSIAEAEAGGFITKTTDESESYE